MKSILFGNKLLYGKKSKTFLLDSHTARSSAAQILLTLNRFYCFFFANGFKPFFPNYAEKKFDSISTSLCVFSYTHKHKQIDCWTAPRATWNGQGRSRLLHIELFESVSQVSRQPINVPWTMANRFMAEGAPRTIPTPHVRRLRAVAEASLSLLGAPQWTRSDAEAVAKELFAGNYHQRTEQRTVGEDSPVGTQHG